jgi:hypothetical protein
MSEIKLGSSCHNNGACGNFGLQCVERIKDTNTFQQCSHSDCGDKDSPKGICYPTLKFANISGIDELTQKSAKNTTNIGALIGVISIGAIIIIYGGYKVKKYIDSQLRY